MANTTCEMMQIHSLLQELEFTICTPMHMYYDNQSIIFIVSDKIFHECTRHIEVDYHYV